MKFIQWMAYIYCWILPVSLTVISCSAPASKSDARIAELMGNQDWFELEREYPALRESAGDTMLVLLGGAMLDVYFNRPEQAVVKIDSLRNHYRDELSPENYSNLIFYYSNMLWKEGQYLKGADELENFLAEMSLTSDMEDYGAHMSLYGLLSLLKDLPAPALERPRHDVVLPLETIDIGRGSVMTLEVGINGEPYRFYFDSGAGMSAISSRLAEELGAKTVLEGIDISGANKTKGSLAIIDKLSVGDIQYKNPVLLVLPPTAIDSIISFDAILGIDFLKAVGETHIYPQDSKVVFPYVFSDLPRGGRNLIMRDNGQSYVEAESAGEKLILHFDTGNVKYDLYQPYYEKHKEDVAKYGKEITLTVGGFGDIMEKQAYRLASFPITVSGTETDVPDMDVYTEQTLDVQGDEDGALGYGFVRLFNKLIVNYEQMFIEVIP